MFLRFDTATYSCKEVNALARRRKSKGHGFNSRYQQRSFLMKSLLKCTWSNNRLICVFMFELCGVLILMYVCGRCISKTFLQAKRGSMWGVYFVPWFVFFRHRNELSRKKIAAPNNSSFLGNWPTFVPKPFSGPRRRPSKLFNGHYFCCFLSVGLKATFISFWAVVVVQW